MPIELTDHQCSLLVYLPTNLESWIKSFSLHVYLQIMGMILVRATLQAMVLIGKELCLMFLIGNGSFFFLLSQGVSPIEHRA